MFTWAKKLGRHPGKEGEQAAGEEGEKSRSEAKLKGEESPTPKRSPEKASPEKKTPSFARRLASFRKMTLERGSSDKSPKLKGKLLKAKSPDKKQETGSGDGNDVGAITEGKTVPDVAPPSPLSSSRSEGEGVAGLTPQTSSGDPKATKSPSTCSSLGTASETNTSERNGDRAHTPESTASPDRDDTSSSKYETPDRYETTPERSLSLDRDETTELLDTVAKISDNIAAEGSRVPCENGVEEEPRTEEPEEGGEAKEEETAASSDEAVSAPEGGEVKMNGEMEKPEGDEKPSGDRKDAASNISDAVPDEGEETPSQPVTEEPSEEVVSAREEPSEEVVSAQEEPSEEVVSAREEPSEEVLSAKEELQPPTPPPERSSVICVVAVSESNGTPASDSETQAQDSVEEVTPPAAEGGLQIESPVESKAPLQNGEVSEAPPEKPPRISDFAVSPPSGVSSENVQETVPSPEESPENPVCNGGTEAKVTEDVQEIKANGDLDRDTTSEAVPVPIPPVCQSPDDAPKTDPTPPDGSDPDASKLEPPPPSVTTAPPHDTSNGVALPSSLSNSTHSIGSYKSLPRPSPARRSSRAGSGSLVQPSSLNSSYDGSDKAGEEKGSPAHASSAVGGSLPSSPSIPRRTRRTHPVPAARSLQTLSSSPGKLSLSVTSSGRGAADTDSAYRKVSLPAKLNEGVREAPVPKPRKMSLNPFDSDDDDNEEEPHKQDGATRGAPVPLPRKKVSLNPFDSDEDEDETVETSREGRAPERPRPPAVSRNPFEEEEEDTTIWKLNPSTGELEFKPKLSSSPATNSRSSSQSSLTIQRLNESIASLNAQLAKSPDETASTNPFDEDDDDDFNDSNLSRDSTRMSFSVTSSSPIQRDGARCSLPPSTRRTGRKKRPAPLPPGQRPPIPSSTTFEHRLESEGLPRGGSIGSFTPQGSPRKSSTGSLSSLSSSPRHPSPRKPPPRPPPPRVITTGGQTRH